MDPTTPPTESLRTFVGAFESIPTESTDVAKTLSPNPADNDFAGWGARLIEANVQADRIASPNLRQQLQQAGQSKIDTLICSVLDTDPSVPLNAMIADSYTAELAVGLDLLSKLTGVRRIWITADPDKPAAWFNSIRLRILNPGLKLVPLRGDYPQTDPTLMLFTLLQRRLAPLALPTEKGALLIDAAAAVALGQCASNTQCISQTPIAVRDHFQQKTHLLEISSGTRLGDVCGFLKIQHTDAVFRAGDFLRDQWITADVPLGHGELVIHATASHLDANPDPCIRCGWCLEACPTRIHPAGLLDAAQHDDGQAAKKFGLGACIECGICSYVCPTRLPLLSAIRGLKKLSVSAATKQALHIR